MKNIGLKMAALFAICQVFVGNAMAQSAYFTLPATFEDDVTATIVGVAGSILVLLALMFAWRKTVKSVNRS